jgi:hypothetical protein
MTDHTARYRQQHLAGMLFVQTQHCIVLAESLQRLLRFSSHIPGVLKSFLGIVCRPGVTSTARRRHRRSGHDQGRQDQFKAALLQRHAVDALCRGPVNLPTQNAADTASTIFNAMATIMLNNASENIVPMP